jgi:AcrR family transcriptional regulator
VAAAVKGVRAYTTTLRRQQAELTRRRVLEAARRLFVAGGYAEVTMQAIAREAGVAYQTVYAQFGNKLALALELCTSEFPHVGQTVNLLVQARDRGDPVAWLRLMGAFARRLYEPCAEILRFMRESGDPDLLSRYREIDAGRLGHLEDLGPQLESSGRLRPGLSAKEAVSLVWMLSGPETYERMVLNRKWTPARFEGWLGPALVQLLLTDS